VSIESVQDNSCTKFYQKKSWPEIKNLSWEKV
jgi:hypothetical protein